MMMREWIVFSLCMGVGGHIALGFVLHAPGLWPWSRAWLYGLISGLVVYGLVQGARGAWKLFRSSPKLPPKNSSRDSW
ncbi:MAG: hypothetical protein JW394_0486 [Nitrospira sp.]|jgi:hypothetical protein|nr:hypothetical protein [Nitrospira sp.]